VTMETYLGGIYWLLLFTLVILGLLQSRTTKRFLKALEEHENESWRDLGSPTLINNSPQITVNVLKSVFQGRFEESANHSVRELAKKFKTDLVVYFLVFGLLLVVFGVSIAAT